MYTYTRAEHVRFHPLGIRGFQSDSNNTRDKLSNNNTRSHSASLKEHMMVHLVLAALGAAAGEAQSLVGDELSATGVDGGADGNSAETSQHGQRAVARSR